MQLTQFKKNSDGLTYHLIFDDGTEADLSTQKLRDNCPCASCQGEQVILHEYKPIHKPPVSTEGYTLENAEPVGNYALKLTWKDGHDTGIYSWKHLKSIINKIRTT